MRLPHSRPAPNTLRALALLAYWPVYGLLFYTAEHVFRPVRFHIMHCWVDDLIPFYEVFIIPYLFWFLYMAGIHVYTFFRDRAAFQKLMWFIILSYSIGLVFFFCYPSIQLLRPAVFPRDNILTGLVAAFYRHDTNTNVFPSLHVVGSLAVHFTARETKLYQLRPWRSFFRVTTFLICVSTVFLKQHSFLDLLGGLLVSWVCYLLVYRREEFKVPARPCRSKKRMSY